MKALENKLGEDVENSKISFERRKCLLAESESATILAF